MKKVLRFLRCPQRTIEKQEIRNPLRTADATAQKQKFSRALTIPDSSAPAVFYRQNEIVCGIIRRGDD